MATVNKRLGSKPCPLCGAGLVVRQNPAGTVTVACTGADGCDFSGFAKAGTKGAQLITRGLAPLVEPAAPAAPAPAPKAGRADPVPFTLGGL